MKLPKLPKMFSKIDLSKIDKKYLIAAPVAIIILVISYTGGPSPNKGGTTDKPSSGSTSVSGPKGPVVIIDPTAPPKKNENKIVIATWKDEISILSDAVDYYKKRNTNVDVEYKTLPVTTYMNDLTASLDRREDIDVFLVRNVNDYALSKDKKLAYDIEQSVRNESIDTAKFGTAFKELRTGGKLYGLPYKRNVYMLFYNKSIFEKMKLHFPVKSMTWTEYKELAKLISRTSKEPKVWGAFMDLAPQSWYIQGVQKGSALSDNNFINFEMALQYRIDMENIGAVPKYKDMQYWKLHYNTEFQNGNIAMNVVGDWHINQLLSSKMKYNWDVAPAPHPDDGNANLSIGNYSIILINANTKNFKMAFDFVKFLTGQDGAKKVAKNLVLPGYIDDNVSSFYAEQTTGTPRNLIAVARQDFLLEYPVDAKGYALANKIYEEESKAVFERKQNIKTFGKKVIERANKPN